MQQSINEHIKQLDISLGGGIISEKIRVDTIDHPMLVIGIGGTGIDALLRLKYQINKRFILPEDPITKKKLQKPNNIEFLAFETNDYDKTKKYGNIGLDLNNELVLLSNPGIGATLNNRSTIPSYISEWLSPELSISDGTKGASGNRQAGRLLLFEKINTVVDSIDSKIKTLRIGREKKLYVFILTGISGGTGSGAFLDIAYIVRGIIEREFGNAGVDKVDTFGYLFMPDVNLSNLSLSVHTQEYIQKNGFAALKELDYWMNIEERGEVFSQKYAGRLDVNSQLPPFNLCHLISGTNVDGKLLENAYDYCMNVTAENIVNFMAQENKESEKEFAIQDYQSNINSNIAQMEKHYAANYKYNILGASAAVLPTEEITTYLAFRLFKKIEFMFEQAPDKQETDNFARKLKLDIGAVEEFFVEKAPPMLSNYEQSDYYSYSNVIKTTRVNLDEKLTDNFLKLSIEEFIKTRRQLPEFLFSNIKDEIKRMFTNPKFGPIYASKLLVSDKGFCVIKTLESYIEVLREELKHLPERIRFYDEDSVIKFEEARKSIFFSADKKKNAYIESKIEQYALKARMECISCMIEAYEDLISLLLGENNKIYRVFTEVLNELNKVLEKDGEIIIHGQEEVNKNNNKTYYWNVISVPDVSKEIDRVMSETNAETLITEFSTMLIQKSNKWIFEDDIDIINCISDFIYDKFGGIVSKTMEEFLELKYGKDRAVEQIIQEHIAPRLYNDAKPVFHLTNNAGMFNFPSYGIVSVPDNVPNILNGVYNYQTNSLSTLRFNIKRSKIRNRIFWLNTQNGIPLFAYAPIKVYEECYERTIQGKEGVGRHLVQTDKNNWINLPSPIPEKSWGDTYTNKRQKEHNQMIRDIFKKALECRSIVLREEGNLSDKYECVITQEFNIDDFMSGFNMDSNMELMSAITRLKGLSEKGLEPVRRRRIFNSINEDNACENFLRNPSLIESMKAEIAKYDRINKKITELTGYVEKLEKEKGILEDFLKAMYTDTIYKKGMVYVYNKNLEEDPWEPFVNLLDESDFPEYRIFLSFKELSAAKRNTLTKKSIVREAQMRNNDEEQQTTIIADNLKKMSSVYGDRKATLDDVASNYTNGAEMYAFYKDMYSRIKSILSHF